MNLKEITKIRNNFWKNNYGTISADEAYQIFQIIKERKPKNFLEIGTASGISGGLICLFLQDVLGNAKFTTVDYDNSFFGEKNKENGFLLKSIYTDKSIEIIEEKFKISLDIAEGKEEYDMAFIDANHMHPWPTLDTISLLPVLKKPSILLHHDYNLFEIQSTPKGIGPKFLFDQWDQSKRIRYKANQGNLFGLIIDKDPKEYSNVLAASLNLPWTQYGNPFITNTGPMENFFNRFEKLINEHYDSKLMDTFKKRFDYFIEKNDKKNQAIELIKNKSIFSFFKKKSENISTIINFIKNI